MEFDGKKLVYNIKFYLEAAWDDASKSITPREDWDKLNPNKWDPRIFLPDQVGDFLHVDKMWIADDQYVKEFGTPMTAYRFIATAAFRAKPRSMKDFPFDHHEITIVVRSRAAEEAKNKGRTVRFHENDKFKSGISSAGEHMANDAFDFADAGGGLCGPDDGFDYGDAGGALCGHVAPRGPQPRGRGLGFEGGSRCNTP